MRRRVRDDLWRWELRLARCTWEDRVRRWRRAGHRLLHADRRPPVSDARNTISTGRQRSPDLPTGEWPTAPMNAVE